MKKTLGDACHRLTSHFPVRSALVLTLLAGILTRTPLELRADVVLSEFAAWNNSNLVDEDGEHSDWAEIYNDSTQSVNLADWFLSDDPRNPAKWRFPGLELRAHQYLIVFLSGKDRTDPSHPLHTNFQLTRKGEFFALFRPTGELNSGFSPFYPEQQGDRSYGFAHEISGKDEFLGPGANGRVHIPFDESLALEWTELDFDDSAWIEGQSGFGFDQKTAPTYTEFIQTDIGSEMRSINSSAYVRIPFELENPAAVDILRLEMRYEDGFIAYVNGLEVARFQAPTAPLASSASTATRTPADARTAQAFDITRSKDVLRPGRNVLAIHGLNSSSNNSDFFVLPRVTALRVDAVTGQRRYFEIPTPGWPNGTGFDMVASRPELSVPGGVYSEAVTVEITAPTPSVEIRYTLDGSVPDADSTLYTGPIEISSPGQLRAGSFAPNFLPSASIDAHYVFMEGDVVDFSSNLPIFLVSTFGTSSRNWVPAHFHVIDQGENGRSYVSSSDEPHYSGNGRIKTRGSSTGGRSKASFSLELWEAEKDPVNFELLGFPADSDWVLYGPFNFDRAHIRNALMYELSNQAGEYAVRTEFVEVFANRTTDPLSSDHYMGLYVFMEKIKWGENRVDVGVLEPHQNSEPEISGGYIIKVDRPDPGDEGFMAGGVSLKHVLPKEELITSTQKAWIIDYLDRMNTALRGPDAADPELGYEAFMDVQSFIDINLFNEFAKDWDSNSNYYHKPRNGKFRAGPLWDYDRVLNQDDSPEGWTGGRGRAWWGGLLADPGFRRRYAERWKQLRKGTMTSFNVLGVIDSMADEIREAQGRNFERWPGLVSGVQGWETEIRELKIWVVQRMNWMDTEFLIGPEFSQPGGVVSDATEVELRNLNEEGAIYYTLNGPDPKRESGAVDFEALVYDGNPIVITENTRIRARIRITSQAWSIMSEEIYVVDVPTLAFTEIMYNPPGGSAYEFLEIQNFGSETVELGDLSIDTALVFDFEAESSLDPGEYLVLINDMDAFVERYPTEGVRIEGSYEGSLRNRGETISIRGPIGEALTSVNYDDDWYLETDGDGHSLVLIDPKSSPSTWNEASSWRASTHPNGSPGGAGSAPLPRQRPGDSNQDARLNLSDALHLVQFLFAGSVSLPCGDGSAEDEANVALLDTNGDGGIDSADSVYNLSYLFATGAPPVQGTECIVIVGCPDVCE